MVTEAIRGGYEVNGSPSPSPMLEQCGQREMEARPAAAGQIRRSQPTAVRFDDRSADSEADAHTGLLGREEALKQVVELTCGYARTSVLHLRVDRFRLDLGGANDQPALSMIGHGLDGVDRKVRKDLLELYAVAPHERKARREIERCADGLAPEFRAEKDHDVFNDVVQGEGQQFRLSVRSHRADPPNDVASAPGFGDRAGG